MCGGDETVLFFGAIEVEEMSVDDKFLAPRRGFILVDVLFHEFSGEVSDLKGRCPRNGGVMPLYGFADRFDRGFEGKEFANANQESELIAYFENMGHELEVDGFANDMKGLGVEGKVSMFFRNLAGFNLEFGNRSQKILLGLGRM